MDLTEHFLPFRQNTIGTDHLYATPYGQVRLLYADWTATGRLYRPIEDRLTGSLGPLVGNTHSESSETGLQMTRAYHLARAIIKRHVNAGPDDVLLTCGAGMTAAVNKLQRILGLRVPERLLSYLSLPDDQRPVVFVTHMEHHSNEISWRETLADVVCLEPGADGCVDPNRLAMALAAYTDRPRKIGAFTACSNVTGIWSPYYELAKLMHAHGGLCFVDFAACAPYQDIDMHPADPLAKLDAVYFSPHKFLGGPGSCGVLLFDRALHANRAPDEAGGGTVDWTSPWEHKYVDDLELREDGGTPGFLQAIRAGMAVSLKDMMGTDRMLAREEQLRARLWQGLADVPGLRILAAETTHRLAITTVLHDHIHYNLLVKVLSDRYGIQTRGGCFCAGPYGHYLFGIDAGGSRSITSLIDEGDQSTKPGWVRISLHPTMTDDEVDMIVAAFREVVALGSTWLEDYAYNRRTNEWRHRRDESLASTVSEWFRL